ncbi:hypothetical protein B0H12DRAFT_94857 [Mycena haematopus]|nr:hypothetical protein B0H12DRAFT_94857 [Mycena haematopus]
MRVSSSPRISNVSCSFPPAFYLLSDQYTGIALSSHPDHVKCPLRRFLTHCPTTSSEPTYSSAQSNAHELKQSAHVRAFKVLPRQATLLLYPVRQRPLPPCRSLLCSGWCIPCVASTSSPFPTVETSMYVLQNMIPSRCLCPPRPCPPRARPGLRSKRAKRLSLGYGTDPALPVQ